MFQRYKVSLNIHNDPFYRPNMRTFEVKMGGLLTYNAEDTSKFFKGNEEVFFYRDEQELTKFVAHLTSNEEDIL